MYRGGRGITGILHAGGRPTDRVSQLGAQEGAPGRGRGLDREAAITAVRLAFARPRALLVNLLLPLSQAEQLLPQPLGPSRDRVVLAKARRRSGAFPQGLGQAGPPDGVVARGQHGEHGWQLGGGWWREDRGMGTLVWSLAEESRDGDVLNPSHSGNLFRGGMAARQAAFKMP